MTEQTNEAPEPTEAPDFSKMGLAELRSAAKERGITAASTMSKKELIRQLDAPVAETPATPSKVPYVSVKAERKAQAERDVDAWIEANPQRCADIDVSTPQGRFTAKRRLAADRAIATMRQNGTLPAASEKAPVDPELSARAKQAWETRRNRQADLERQAAEKAVQSK